MEISSVTFEILLDKSEPKFKGLGGGGGGMRN